MSLGARTVAPPDLIERLRSDGLRIEESERGPVAIGTGELQAELTAATTAAALGWAPGRTALEVRGDDRVPFLQRMLTQGLLDASEGDVRRSLLLDRKGRIVADLDLGFETDRILILGAPEATAATVETLQRYVLRADVHFEGLDRSHVVLRLLGPEATSALGTVAKGLATDEALTRMRGAEATFRACRSPLKAPEGIDLVVPAEEATRLWSALLDAGGVHPVGAAAAELLRLEAGVPVHGAEITGSEFPQEVRLEAAVDFDKGCYLGQETVARIHYRGKVNRLLVGLVSADRLSPGVTLRAGDREVGSLTSAARRPDGDWLALGYVRTEQAEPGTLLTLVEDAGPAGTCRVRDVAWWGASHAPRTDPASVS